MDLASCTLAGDDSVGVSEHVAGPDGWDESAVAYFMKVRSWCDGFKYTWDVVAVLLLLRHFVEVLLDLDVSNEVSFCKW